MSNNNNYDARRASGRTQDDERSMPGRRVRPIDYDYHPRENFFQKYAGAISIITFLVVQGFAIIWWAATLSSKVETIDTVMKGQVTNRYLKSQADADKLNIELKLDQLKTNVVRLEEEVQKLEGRVEKLYDKVYTIQ